METVPRAWVDGFADSLEMISDEMGRRLSDELAKVDYDMPVAYVREWLVAIMQAYCYESRSMAAQAAAEFYDGLRQLQTGERIGAVAIDGYNPMAVERRVRSAVEPLAKAQRLVEGPAGEFWADAGTKKDRYREATRRAARELCKALIDYQGYGIKSAAGGTVFGNGARDDRRVRFARIPRGSEHYPNGCPFCQMLASMGFVYRSELAAGGLDPDHYHSDCQCMVVPSWGPGSVEGYDPSDYDEGYKEYLAQDHSEHDKHVAETQRNRYDAMGRLKSGDGNRVDEKGALTNEDRALVRSKRTAKGNETRRADRSRMFYGLGVTENEWKAMSEAEQAALLGNKGVNPHPALSVEIDGLVPCLIRTSDGEIVPTTVTRVSGKDLKKYNKRSGWFVNWSTMESARIAGHGQPELYRLDVEGSDEPQGLVAIARPTERGAYPYGLWAVSNPKSQASVVGRDGKEYKGIGGHLFAIMCEKSFEWGYDGVVDGVAKDYGVLDYYLKPIEEDGMGATLVSYRDRKFYIDEDSAAELMRIYNYEWM